MREETASNTFTIKFKKLKTTVSGRCTKLFKDENLKRVCIILSANQTIRFYARVDAGIESCWDVANKGYTLTTN